VVVKQPQDPHRQLVAFPPLHLLTLLLPRLERRLPLSVLPLAQAALTVTSSVLAPISKSAIMEAGLISVVHLELYAQLSVVQLFCVIMPQLLLLLRLRLLPELPLILELHPVAVAEELALLQISVLSSV